ncbi:hypothetical protein JXA59_03340 [Patescibacteria group bacterium]|nr:hypothetical protein [Patescibacteria group bacterium]
MDRTKLLDYLLGKFSVTENQLKQHRLFYNNHFNEYGNEVYEDVKTRLVHLQNFWDDSLWFNQRYDLLFKKYQDFDQIIELGFSLPYLYLQDDVSGLKNKPLLLVDHYDSAIQVAKEIVDYLKVSNVQLIKSDIQSKEGWNDIQNKIIDGKRLFVAVETIEHLDQPELFWENIHRFVGDKIILSLPIGPAIPSHNLAMKDDQEALEYLEQYIDVAERQFISPSDKRGEGLDDYKVLIVFGAVK